jgi:hypothetical protein
VKADEEFYRIAVCEKIACTVRRRGTGDKSPVSTLRQMAALFFAPTKRKKREIRDCNKKSEEIPVHHS